MKFNKIMQFIIFVFLIVFIINSGYNHLLNNFLIKTQVITEGVLLKGYDTQGYILKKETLIKADSEGPINILVSDGQRISKKHPVISQNGQNILSPVSGIVSFKYDKLEDIGDPYELGTFNFEDIKLNYKEYDNTGKKEFLKNEVILKIQDNLDRPKLYLELPIMNFNEPLQMGQVLTLKLPDEEKTIKVKIIKLKGIGQNAILLLEFIDMPEQYTRIQDLKIVSEEIKTLMIPKKSFLELNGKEGIYVVIKGLVNFKEINIIGEEEGFFLTDSLKPNTEIILNPRFVSDGKYLR